MAINPFDRFDDPIDGPRTAPLGDNPFAGFADPEEAAGAAPSLWDQLGQTWLGRGLSRAPNPIEGAKLVGRALNRPVSPANPLDLVGGLVEMGTNAATLAGRVASGDMPTHVLNPETGRAELNPAMIEQAFDLASFAGGTGAGRAAVSPEALGTLGSSGGRLRSEAMTATRQRGVTPAPEQPRPAPRQPTPDDLAIEEAELAKARTVRAAEQRQDDTRMARVMKRAEKEATELEARGVDPRVIVRTTGLRRGTGGAWETGTLSDTGGATLAANDIRGTAPIALANASTTPVLPISKSIAPRYVFNLLDGVPHENLGAHLASKGITPAQYRAHFSLPDDYPMLAPDVRAGRIEALRYQRLPDEWADRPDFDDVIRQQTAKAGAASTIQPAELTAHIANAAYRLGGNQWSTRVRLADLREATPPDQWGAVQKELLAMTRRGDAALFGFDNPREITPRDRGAMMPYGGEQAGIVYVKNPPAGSVERPRVRRPAGSRAVDTYGLAAGATMLGLSQADLAEAAEGANPFDDFDGPAPAPGTSALSSPGGNPFAAFVNPEMSPPDAPPIAAPLPKPPTPRSPQGSAANPFDAFGDPGGGAEAEKSAASRILEAGKRGLYEPFEGDIGLSPETVASLRAKGIFPAEGTSFTQDPARYLVEQGLTGAAAMGDVALRDMRAPITAGAAVVGQAAEELGASQGMAARLERDVVGLTDAALLVTGAPRPGVRLPRAPRAAAEAGGAAETVNAAPDVPPPPVALLEPPRPAAPSQRPTMPGLTDPSRLRFESQEGSGAAKAGPESPGAGRGSAGAGGPSEGATGTTRPKGDGFAGNINLDRINSADDVKDAIQRGAQRFDGFTEARRGKMTFDEIREMASGLGMTEEKLRNRVKGQAFNAEELFAARELMVEAAEAVRNKARLYASGSDADKLAAMQSVTRLLSIQEHVAGATAEAGRALSQFRMLAGQNRSAETIRQLIRHSEANGGRVEGIMEGIARMGDDASPISVASFVNRASRATSRDMLFEAWINGLLSGPQTHATNILSNSLVSMWSIPESAVAAGISRMTGSGISLQEPMARTFGMVEGIKDGLRAAVRTFRTEEPTGGLSKLEQDRFRAIPSVRLRKGKENIKVGGVSVPLTGEVQFGGKQVRIPGRLLMAEDEVFKAIGYRQEVNALAYRQASKEGLKGHAWRNRIAFLKGNPTPEMEALAHSAAEKQTFTNPLGRFGRAVQTMANSVPLARVVVPFIRTPTNIIKFAAERSPFAPLFKEVRDNMRGLNGPIARDQQVARIALGSSVSLYATTLAAEGHITGGGPTDPRERSELLATGWQPYSLKIGDRYYSFARLEPLGSLLGVAADFTELGASMKAKGAENIAALILGSVQKNLLDKTWTSGIADLIEVANDPDRYGARYVQRLVGTVIPTGVAQVARVNDPYLREAKSIMDTLRSRTPGLSESLPARRNVWGEPIKKEGSLGPDLLSPIYMSTDRNDPVLGELRRLDLRVMVPRPKIRNVELDSDEAETLRKVSGAMARRLLGQVIESKGYDRVSDEIKIDLLERAMRKVGDHARAHVLKQHPALVSRIAEQARQKVRRVEQSRVAP